MPDTDKVLNTHKQIIDPFNSSILETAISSHTSSHQVAVI